MKTSFDLAKELLNIIKRAQEPEADAEETEHDMRRSALSMLTDWIDEVRRRR